MEVVVDKEHALCDWNPSKLTESCFRVPDTPTNGDYFIIKLKECIFLFLKVEHLIGVNLGNIS